MAEFKKIKNFLIIGLFLLILEFLIILLINNIFKLDLYLCRLISMPIAIFLGWYLNRTYTFQNKSINYFKQIGLYYFYISLGICINYLFYIGALNFFDEFKYRLFISVCIGALSTMVFNYVAMKWLIFNKQ